MHRKSLWKNAGISKLLYKCNIEKGTLILTFRGEVYSKVIFILPGTFIIFISGL